MEGQIKGEMLITGASGSRWKVQSCSNKSQNYMMCILLHLMMTLVCSKGVSNGGKQEHEQIKIQKKKRENVGGTESFTDKY